MTATAAGLVTTADTVFTWQTGVVYGDYTVTMTAAADSGTMAPADYGQDAMGFTIRATTWGAGCSILAQPGFGEDPWGTNQGCDVATAIQPDFAGTSA
jgi:hypothetical protein